MAPAPRPPRVLRRLADLLVRGPEAPYVLGDLDEGWARDLARGMSVGRARRRYLRNAVASAASLARRRARLPNLGASFLDVKLGVRMLRKQPALTAVAVFALSMGIPVGMLPLHLAQVTSATLPFDEGEEIVRLQLVDLERSRVWPRQLRDYDVWRSELTSFESLGIASPEVRNVVADDGRAAPVQGSAMSASIFEMLRVAPALGRRLVEADEVDGAPDVVVVGHDLWQARLGGDPDVLGRSIRIGKVPHEVVGVMPEGFLFPDRDHFWVPFRADPLEHAWGEGPYVPVYGRLADGVTLAQANVELTTVSRRIAAEHPDTHRLLRAEASPVAGDEIYRSPVFWMMQLMALLLLTVTCGNVGTLILARTATRTGEIAVRTALGASRARIVGQLFVEALVLALLGAGFGLWIGDMVADRFQAIYGPQGLPFWLDLSVTWQTALTTLGLAAFCAGVAGVLPAIKATGRGVQSSLQRAAAGVSGLRFGGLSTVLIVAEVALATAFLAIGGQVLPSVLQDPSDGMTITPGEYLTAQLKLPWAESAMEAAPTDSATYRARVAAAHEELVRRLSAEPAVRGVALASRLPGQDHGTGSIEVEGADDGVHEVRTARVEVGYFRGLDHAPRVGRDFTRADVSAPAKARTAVIVNETFADQVLHGRHPLGQRVRWHAPEQEPGPWLEIVGVVGHLGLNEINPARDAGVYEPVAPGEVNPVRMAVRVDGDPTAFIPELRRIASEVDPDALIDEPMALPDLIHLSDTRLGSYWGGILVLMIAGVAIVLSAAGLYALVSFTVSERRREIGIRTALGARATDIVSTIARRAFLQLALGVLAGIGLRRLLDLELDLVNDPAMHQVDQTALFAIVAGATLAIGLAACIPPLVRGLRVRPVEVLKEV